MREDIYTTGRKVFYNDIGGLFDLLRDLNYAVVKGEALSKQIYGSPRLRRSNDIDLLIDRKYIGYVERYLLDNGYKQIIDNDNSTTRMHRILCMAYSHQIPSYHKDKLGFHLNVDINYDIFWGEYEGSRVSMGEFLNDTEDVEIYGAIVKALPLEKAFVHLVLHHYKEMNSLFHLCHYNCIRTYMFKDIYDMLINNKDRLNLATLKDLARQYHISGIMYYMLFYTNIVFGGALECLVNALKNEEGEFLLDKYGLCDKERKKWTVPFKKRLDNDAIWENIKSQLTSSDYSKIILNNSVFS